MIMSRSNHKYYIKPSLLIISKAISILCAISFVALILSLCSSKVEIVEYEPPGIRASMKQALLDQHGPCDEIYVVKEGETLNTVSEKCGDPYIVENNPHIHDPDDIFPGLVIQIVPLVNRKLSREA